MSAPCPLCGAETRGSMQVDFDGAPGEGRRVVDCTRCGRFLLDEPAQAVLDLADAPTRRRVAAHLQDRRARGETQPVRLSPALFV